jgi:DNA-binding NarL/FixJ family response regulator
MHSTPLEPYTYSIIDGKNKTNENNMIRVILVDDQETVRKGLHMWLLLEPDIMVVGEASTGREALSLAQVLHPDVILMDIEMPEMDGITATSALLATLPQSAIVILSIHDDSISRMQAQTAGAAAYVEKRGKTEILLAAIRQAAHETP